MLLDFARLDVHFDPPLYEKPRRLARKAILNTADGKLLAGIIVRYRKGGAVLDRVNIPEIFTITNRPELGNPRYTPSQLERDTLRVLIEERLQIQRRDADLVSKQHRW